MKSRICCDYRTTILSNSFFHATTLLSIYHEKCFQSLHAHGFGSEQKLSRIDGYGLKIPRIGGFTYPYSPPSNRDLFKIELLNMGTVNNKNYICVRHPVKNICNLEIDQAMELDIKL